MLTIAEESTSWSGVSRPTYLGGLGFSLKWNMGWMNDTLVYMSKDPVYRKYDHGSLTFSMIYAFNENFLLPLSHDEVVHGKGSLLDKMPGDLWQKFANLRLLYGYMYGHPGKKLLYMGSEFAQWREWSHDQSLDWHLLQWRDHQGIYKLVSDLNAIYRSNPAFYEVDFEWQGFEWLELHDWENSVLAFLRRARDPNDSVVVVCNFTPVVREDYRIGVPSGGFYREILNTDADIYGGSNAGNEGGVWARREPHGGRPYHLVAPRPAPGRRLPQDADRVVKVSRRRAASESRIPPALARRSTGRGLVGEVLEPLCRFRGDCLGLRRLGHLGGAEHLGDQLVDRHVPLHLADRDDGRFLARVEPDDPAGPVVAEAGDHHAVAGLEQCAGLDQARVVARPVLEVGQPLVQRLAAPLGLGLGGEGRLSRLLGVLAELLHDLQLGDVLSPGLLQVAPCPGDRGARAGRAGGRSAARWTGRCRRCGAGIAAGASPGRTRPRRSRPGGSRRRRSSGRRCGS